MTWTRTITSGSPLNLAQLRARYERLSAGHSPDGAHGWLNWTVRERGTGDALGTVQATLARCGPGVVAELAWIIGSRHQRTGYAVEGADAMVGWPRGEGVECFVAQINPAHGASIAVAKRLGLHATAAIRDGEVRWCS